MNVLIVGGGGREHAIAWKIAQSRLVDKIFCAPGNAGTAFLSKTNNIDIQPDNIDSLLKFAKDNSVGFTIVGPEAPLIAGIVDRFSQAGHKIFGPRANAAIIEGSKAFSKDFLKKYKIPTARYETFSDPIEAKEYVLEKKYPLVVKADGIAAGKGVIICRSTAEAESALDLIMLDKAFGSAGEKVVVEEFLEGEEVSFMVLTDGKNILPLMPCQDHKQIYDNDTGPNTGGMGAYCPAPVLDTGLHEVIMQSVIRPAVEGMNAEGRPYNGVLYAGLMLTDSGPKVLEFNARFGDPETQPIMAMIESDLLQVLIDCSDEKLDPASIKWRNGAAVCVVITAEGYPGNYKKGDKISGLAEASTMPDITVFHVGTKLSGNDVLTSGGRVLGVTGIGDSIESAITNAYSVVKKISWPGAYCRKDIGRKALARINPANR